MPNQQQDPSDVAASQTTIAFPWWANPNILLVISLLVVLYVILFVPAEQYAYWETPKYVTPVEGIETIGIIIAVLLGTTVGAVFGKTPEPHTAETTREFLRTRGVGVLFYIFALLTFIGYAFWIGKALQSGVTIDSLASTLKGDPGALSRIKSSAQPTAGVTTLTQFGPLVVVLGIARKRLVRKAATIIVLLVISLSLIRFLFYAERIAFLEVVVPAVIMVAALWPQRVRWPKLRRITTGVAPVVMGVVVFALFALGEYFRSWTFVRQQTNQTFLEFITSRFLSYYATATNNGVLYGRLANQEKINNTTFYMFYNFPGNLFGSDTVAGTDAARWWGLQLELYANPSLTNTGMVFPLIGEITYVPVLLIFFFLAMVSAILFRKAKHGHLVAMLFVPVLCFAASELPRIPYLLLGRSVPMLLGILLVWFVFDLWQAAKGKQLQNVSG